MLLSHYKIDDRNPMTANCFGSLFNPSFHGPDNPKKLVSTFYLPTFYPTKEIFIDNYQQICDDWYFPFFISKIPERIKETFIINDLNKDSEINEYVRSFLSIYENKIPILNWKKLSVDLTKITGEDLYVLLVMLRLPIAYPSVIAHAYKLIKENSWLSEDTCFYLSAMYTCFDAAHTICCHYSSQGSNINCSKQDPNFEFLEALATISFSKRWQSIYNDVNPDLVFSKTKHHGGVYQHFKILPFVSPKSSSYIFEFMSMNPNYPETLLTKLLPKSIALLKEHMANKKETGENKDAT